MQSRCKVSERVTVNMKHEVKLLPVVRICPKNDSTYKEIRHWGIKRVLFFHVQITGKEVPHNPSWPLPLQAYVVVHFLLVLRTYHDLFENKMVSIWQIRENCRERRGCV